MFSMESHPVAKFLYVINKIISLHFFLFLLQVKSMTRHDGRKKVSMDLKGGGAEDICHRDDPYSKFQLLKQEPLSLPSVTCFVVVLPDNCFD